MSRFARHSRRRALLVAIVLAAVLLRALIPAGFMPAELNGAGSILKLCDAVHSGSHAMLGPDGGEAARGGHTKHSDNCPFAATAFGMSPPISVAALFIFPPLSSAVHTAAQIPDSSRILRAQSARAPPLLS
jgi:hypothetical protein